MALQTSNPPTSPSAQLVGNAFVDQYYHILHHSPELVYRFYQDSSVLSRPDNNGQMTSVTTMQGINEKILSLDYKNYKAEIKTADAQKSYKEGVTVLVTGCLTGKDNLKRKFAQSFFLAPQDNGYFVLNDVFRYLEDGELLENHRVNDVENVPKASSISTPAEGLAHVPDPSAPDPSTFVVEGDQNAAEKAYEPSAYEIQIGNEEEAVDESQSHLNGNGNGNENENEISIVAESASSSAQEDAPKQSYASIVKVTQGSPGPTKVYVPTNTAKVTPKKIENQSIASAPSAQPETSAPSSIDVPENDNNHGHEEVEGYSIYIRNLPFSITPTQLEQEFKRFGLIKQDGVQVRNNKQQGYCFGFVEFLSLSSMKDAIQASPLKIGGRQAVVEIKRTSNRVGSGRGTFPSRMAGFRNDSFRSRGNYGGGRGFGRNEYAGRGEFFGRGRGSAGRGEGRGRGRGRGGRSSESK